MQFVAPASIDHFNFDNVEYRREGPNNTFDIRHPEHIAMAKRHGAVEFVPGQPVEFNKVETADRIPSDFDEQNARLQNEVGVLETSLHDANAASKAKDARIAELEAKLAAAQAAPGAADIPADAGAASDDTSSSTGGTADQQGGGTMSEQSDKQGEPNFDDMSRDQMVHWLKEHGVVVPVSISKADARTKIDEALATKSE